MLIVEDWVPRSPFFLNVFWHTVVLIDEVLEGSHVAVFGKAEKAEQ